jgi:hypothetical protein
MKAPEDVEEGAKVDRDNSAKIAKEVAVHLVVKIATITRMTAPLVSVSAGGLRTGGNHLSQPKRE